MDPLFQMKMQAMFPDLNPAEMEACSNLGRGDAKYVIRMWGGSPQQENYKRFKEKVRLVDPQMARLLDEAERSS